LEVHDRRYGPWAIVDQATGLAAGTAMLKPLPNGEGEIEVGWRLHPDSWGRGYATEAGAALVAAGFDEGLDEIWAVTNLDNPASMNVCRRIGMRLLGSTHRWYEGPSLMWWIGATPALTPSLEPDGPPPAEIQRETE
jgi:RimJ/RimL family protein N-acetyltransferase